MGLIHVFFFSNAGRKCCGAELFVTLRCSRLWAWVSCAVLWRSCRLVWCVQSLLRSVWSLLSLFVPVLFERPDMCLAQLSQSHLPLCFWSVASFMGCQAHQFSSQCVVLSGRIRCTAMMAGQRPMQSSTRPNHHHHRPPVGSQPVPRGEPLDDSPVPNSPIRDTLITDSDALLLRELQGASAVAMPRSIVPRHTREP